MPNIDLQLHVYRELKSRILAANPELSEDDQTLLDTLEGATDLKDGLIAVMAQADYDEALAKGLSNRMAEMKARKDRLMTRAEGRRALVLWAMQEAGISKIEAPEQTFSQAKTPGSVVITDEAALPPCYVRTKTEPDKRAIGEALKKGDEVPGAIMSNGGIRLNVRKA